MAILRTEFGTMYAAVGILRVGLQLCVLITLTFCLTSTEARVLIRDGDTGARDRESEGSTARTDPVDGGGRGPPPEQWKC